MLGGRLSSILQSIIVINLRLKQYSIEDDETSFIAVSLKHILSMFLGSFGNVSRDEQRLTRTLFKESNSCILLGIFVSHLQSSRNNS
ncbi:hypothetical protein TorRG33x02_237630 [Trema orientale]|uniref:Uncharacterized protein n=1 Tax=Trema orientale TaxID=63057 RepID=A0A2P5DZK3_TREOI|nr:hypothetical protein TorRG33x02_237630 [Trema orientale]